MSHPLSSWSSLTSLDDEAVRGEYVNLSTLRNGTGNGTYVIWEEVQSLHHGAPQ